jgi:hypothetical protein
MFPGRSDGLTSGVLRVWPELWKTVVQHRGVRGDVERGGWTRLGPLSRRRGKFCLSAIFHGGKFVERSAVRLWVEPVGRHLCGGIGYGRRRSNWGRRSGGPRVKAIVADCRLSKG